MEKQHYVPKTYLRGFCKNEGDKIFGTQYIEKTKTWSNPQEYNISSICYSLDFYNLTVEQVKSTSLQKDVIERTAFWYEKDFIKTIIKKLSVLSVNDNDINSLSRFILNMKNRNPKFKEGYRKENILRSLTEAAKEVKEKYLPIINAVGMDFELLIKKMENEILIDEEKSKKKFHTESLLKNMENPIPIYQNALELLRNYNIKVFEIEDNNEFFITTDNPGFSLGIDGVVYNVKLIEDLFHFFPLNSKLGVAFYNPLYSSAIQKNELIKPNPDIIYAINRACAIWRNQFVYCENKAYLKSFTDRLLKGNN